MSKLFSMLITLIWILFVFCILGGITVGAGYILTLLLPFNLFQGSMFVMGLSFFSIFLLYISETHKASIARSICDNCHESMDDQDDYSIELDQKEMVRELKKDILESLKKEQNHFYKTQRNEKCPCGSGKKFKFCCLNKDLGTLIKSEQDTDSIPF